VTDTPLLRNKSGTARDRDPSEPVDELEFEAAIGRNVRQLRQQQGLTVAETAARVGISKAMMSKIENAQTSCSLSTLALLAKGFDVPVTSLFRGAEVERPAAFVRAGTGARIVRNGTREGHEYELLGSLRGEHKRLECLQVTLTAKSKTYPLFQHPGTEFIYMLEGVMDYSHSRSGCTPAIRCSSTARAHTAPWIWSRYRSGSSRSSRSPTRRCSSRSQPKTLAAATASSVTTSQCGTTLPTVTAGRITTSADLT
jgi:transcriptional regulator with XRE-family HTH domain